MNPGIEKNRRLFGLFLLACLLFNYPIISIFNLPRLVFGIPLLYMYIFIVWSLIIVMIAWISIEPKRKGPDRGRQKRK